MKKRNAFLRIMPLWLFLAFANGAVGTGSTETLAVHRFRFFIHPDLVGSLSSDELHQRLVLYVQDLNAIFSKQTVRCFTFNPDTDITVTTDTPESGGFIGELPLTGYEVWAHVLPSSYPAYGSYGGYASLDQSGAGVAADLHWDAVHDRSALLTGSGSWDLAQYWHQLHNLTHEIEHIFGAGLGEYYNLRQVNDTTGLAPVVNINFNNNPANDPYWSAHPDFYTDPLTIWTPTDLSYSNLMTQVRFADLTAAILNAEVRGADLASWTSTLPDLTHTTISVRDQDTGAAVGDANVKIWKVHCFSPYDTESLLNANTDAAGKVQFNWTGGLNNYDQLMLIKVYPTDGHSPRAQWASIYDAQAMKMLQGSDSFEVRVCTIVDTDGDGISDVAELANGLNPNNPSDALVDSDGDGFTNLEEYRIGTDPNAPASTLDILATDQTGNDVTIGFKTCVGKAYRVEYNDSFPGGTWTGIQSLTGTGAIMQVADPGAASKEKRFYRVRLVASP